MIFSEEHKIVNALPAKDQNAQTITTDIISMKNYDHCTFIISFGVCHTDAATSTNLIACKGENVTTCATAFICKYRAELDATADTLGTTTTLPAAGISLGASGDEDIGTGGGFLVVEIDAENLEPTVANPYDTVKLGMVWGGVATEMSIIAILSKGRYVGATQPTAITD